MTVAFLFIEHIFFSNYAANSTNFAKVIVLNKY